MSGTSAQTGLFIVRLGLARIWDWEVMTPASSPAPVSESTYERVIVLDQRHLDLRLLTHRGGEAKLSAQALRLESIWGNASRLRPVQGPATL